MPSVDLSRALRHGGGHDAIELGKIKPGNLVCLVAFGAGLTWGSAFLRY
jgi:hypothetical protein